MLRLDPYPQATNASAAQDQLHRLDPYPQATIAGMELERTASMDPYPQATIANPQQGQTLRLDPYPQATNASPELERELLADSASRDNSAMEPQVEGPVEAAVGESRGNDPPTGAADSVDTPLLTPWTLPVDATSTGVDSGVSPLAMMEQRAWDASVMPISSTETDADELPIARVAVTTEQSRWPSSTGVGTDLHASTQALEDDGADPARTGSADIVESGPRAEPPRAVPVSDAMVPIVAVNVAAESREQGGTQQGRIRIPLVWGQGIPLRPSITVQRPAGSVPSRAAVADQALDQAADVDIVSPADTASRTLLPIGSDIHSSSALSLVSDAIDPASCPAATLGPSVRAEAHEVVISRRAEAAVTVTLATTSRNRLNLEGQRVVLRGALMGDTFTLFRVYKCKKKAILASHSHLWIVC